MRLSFSWGLSGIRRFLRSLRRWAEEPTFGLLPGIEDGDILCGAAEDLVHAGRISLDISASDKSALGVHVEGVGGVRQGNRSGRSDFNGLDRPQINNLGTMPVEGRVLPESRGVIGDVARAELA